MASDVQSGGTGLVAGGVAVVVVVGAICLGGLFVVGILAAIAIPNFVAMQLKAKRAEVPAHVDGIRTAQLAYNAAFGRWLPVGSEADARRSVSTEPRPFVVDEAWAELGWTPEGEVRGAYWAVVTPAGVEVHGVCDVDGDGVLAEYVAGPDTNARAITPPDVY